MKTTLTLLLAWLLGTGVLPAATPLENAQRARELLGPGVWSRVVRIENSARSSVYPRTVEALIFEFSGLLWFYTDENGTQSLSRHRGRLAAEKGEIAALLQGIDPGFGSHRVLSDAELGPVVADDEMLRNGCFIVSVAALRDRLSRGELIEEAKLLLYYPPRGGVRGGHTVLAYATPSGSYAWDAMRERGPRKVGARMSEDALGFARKVAPRGSVGHARWLPVEELPGAALTAARAGTGGNPQGG